MTREPTEPEGDLDWYRAELASCRKAITGLRQRVADLQVMLSAANPRSPGLPPANPPAEGSTAAPPPYAMAWAVVDQERIRLTLTFWQGEVSVTLLAESAHELHLQLAQALADFDATARRCPTCAGPMLDGRFRNRATGEIVESWCLNCKAGREVAAQ